MLAAYCGHLELIKYFESKNYDIHKVDKHGWNIYIYAAYKGYVEIMKHLEDTHNWNIYTKANDGKSAFSFINTHESVREHLTKNY